MPVVSVVNTKGGAGKTTTAVFLALAAAKSGKDVILLDGDGQATASDWWWSAQDNGQRLPFRIETVNSSDLLRRTFTGAQWVFIDTPPGESAVIKSAIQIADFVVIPTKTTNADMWRTIPTVEGSDHRLQGVLITQARQGTRSLHDARKFLADENIEVFDTVIPLREAIGASVGQLPTDLFGYENVFTDIEKAVK